MHNKKIIIVGGGLSGLGCAKRLHELGVDFTIITENIGGRVKVSADGETNYGAYYVTDDSHTIMPYVKKVSVMHFAKAHFHRDGAHYHAYSFRMLKHIPAVIRLLIDVIDFQRRLTKARARAMEVPYRECIEADPYLRKYYHQKAGEYIKERRLEKLTKEYLEQFLWAAYFTDPREVSTTVFLGVLKTLIIPSYSFTFNFEKLIAPFTRSIIEDSVVRVRRLPDGTFQLHTKSGNAYECDVLVLATPMNITNQLIPPQKIKGGIDVNYYHIRGTIKKEYDVPWYNFFPVEEEAAISRELNGTYLYFYGSHDNIDKYFEHWEVIAKDSWRPALFFFGDEYVNENPEPGIYLANDHDVPGTEDAFINGHYIANLVVKNGRAGFKFT